MAEERTSYDAFVEFLSTPMRDGQPYVLETRHAVSLHFDHFATQSFMSLGDPEKLALGYTRAMMGFLLLQPAPAHICMIGLGGGSLAKYCYRHLPGAAIDAVEISAEVIALRDVFRIPADDARFRVVCADGADYVTNEDIRTDVILLDAFVTDGIASRCADLAFFDACRERLTETGVLVINFTDDDPALPLHLERLRSVFGACYAIVRCGDDSNFVAFAWKSGYRLPSTRVLSERARSFAVAGELELSATARRLKAGERLDPDRLVWHAKGSAHWAIGA
ncbi:spermidine synthase [Burkholderia stagnalis]|uniref:spermine/spermidine synthase domain-containing protein n=1 Tax=Burkholderia stagnalis TaxID=1503054 RepID=UPI000F8119B0|nr:spermidine synthase [Burkholderia stagnalis]